MQVDAQNPLQPKPRREYPFKPGRSGNPSGLTRTQLRTREYMEAFERVHGRAPDVIKMATIRNAGALSARIERNKTSSVDLVRCGRLLRQLLTELGLAGDPAPAKGGFPEHGLQQGGGT